MISYSRHSISDDDIRVIIDVLKSDYITQGPKIEEFEDDLRSYCGSRYAVVFSSGTAALHAAYYSSGIRNNDEIITSPISFAATANAALYLGAVPVFVDIEPDTGNLDPNLIRQAITDKTKAIVPVHYAGHPVDLDLITQVAREHNLIVIEDACHALGARYKGKNIGGFSDLTVFSFHPVKPITTGEGGAVLTNSSEYYEKLKMFRSHGITKDHKKFKNRPHGEWYYEMQFLGYNYRITDVQCALGINQLKKLDSFIKRKIELKKEYENAFSNISEFTLPSEKSYANSSWHLYPIKLRGDYIQLKPDIFTELRRKRIGVQVHYIPVYLHPFYRSLGYHEKICPKAEDFYRSEMSLPLYQSMEEKDLPFIIKEIKNCLFKLTKK